MNAHPIRIHRVGESPMVPPVTGWRKEALKRKTGETCPMPLAKQKNKFGRIKK
jgi:hypothetical protein